jgi:hypothetical protein
MGNGRRYCAAFLMAQNHEQRRLQMIYGIFDTSNGCGFQNLTRGANHEDFSQILVEERFRGDTRIRTTQDDGQGFLSGHQFFPSQVKSSGGPLAFDKSLIAGQEIFQGHFSTGCGLYS